MGHPHQQPPPQARTANPFALGLSKVLPATVIPALARTHAPHRRTGESRYPDERAPFTPGRIEACPKGTRWPPLSAAPLVVPAQAGTSPSAASTLLAAGTPYGRHSANPHRRTGESRDPTPCGAIGPRPLPAVLAPPLVVPANAGTQGRGAGAGGVSVSRHSPNPHRRLTSESRYPEVRGNGVRSP